MKKNCVLLLVLFLTQNIFSQEFDFRMQDEIKKDRPMIAQLGNSFYSLKIDNKGFMNIKRVMHNIYLYKYDDKFHELKNVKAPGEDNQYGPIVPQIMKIGNRLMLLYSVMTRKDSVAIFLSEVDTSTLGLKNIKEILVFRPDINKLIYYLRTFDWAEERLYISEGVSEFSYEKRRTFYFETSSDGLSHCIVWTSGWDNKLYFSILDNELHIKKSGIEEIPCEKAFSLSSVIVDNEQNAFVLCKYFNKPEHKMELIALGSQSSRKKIDINLPNAEIVNGFASIKPLTGVLSVCGTYRENSKNLTGVFNQVFDVRTFEGEPIQRTPFPKDLIESFARDGYGIMDAKDMGITTGFETEISVLKNGDVVLTSEVHSGIPSMQHTFSFNGNILSIRFTTDKRVLFTRIPKIRVNQGAWAGDYFKTHVYDNNVLIFYNDHLNNLSIGLMEKPERNDTKKDIVFACAIIGENGQAKRLVLEDKSKEGFIALTGRIICMEKSNFFLAWAKMGAFYSIGNDYKWSIFNIK